ncbi:MAG: hypothetical protein PWP03_101 [Candidatus Woesearchaeota archaeon]|nr:hypothetical protein [Candidatus Woesearchaeota archaeon]
MKKEQARNKKNTKPKDERLSIKLRGNTFYIEYEGEPKISLVKELRKLVDSMVSESEISESFIDEEEELNYSLMEISPDLKRNSEFRKLIKDLLYSEEQHIIRKISINNLITIKVDKDKKVVRASLNENEWNKEVNELFSEINAENISHCIIHIITSLNQNEIDFLLDTVKKYVFFKPIKVFTTKKENSAKTTMECIIFGSKILKEPEND